MSSMQGASAISTSEKEDLNAKVILFCAPIMLIARIRTMKT